MKEFFNTRVGMHLKYGLIYVIFYKLTGFELTMIVITTTILGELEYQFKK